MSSELKMHAFQEYKQSVLGLNFTSILTIKQHRLIEMFELGSN